MVMDEKTEEVLLKGLEHSTGTTLGDVELYLLSGRTLSVEVRKGELDHFQDARSIGLGVRVIRDHACGYSYTEDLSQNAVNTTVEKASRIAALNPPDEHNLLAEPYEDRSTFYQVDEDLEKTQISNKIEMARELEQTALAADKRIVNVPEASYGDGFQEVTLLNSKGLRLTYARGGAGLSISIMAKEGDEIKNPYKYKFSNRLNRLDPRRLALDAAHEAQARLGSRSPVSGSMPVVFDNESGRELLAVFSGMFSAKNVQKGLSLLGGKLDEQVGSKLVTIHDNALLPEGNVSRPFDDEGTPSRDTPVVKEGVLKNFLHNLYTASKDGVQSTGNASRGSINTGLETAPSNFYLEPGEGTADDLMKDAGEGIMIVELHGLHSGANAISGDFSLGAQGYHFKG
jgi:PmbA protein